MENNTKTFNKIMYLKYLNPKKSRIIWAETIDLTLFISIFIGIVFYYAVYLDNTSSGLALFILFVYLVVQLLILFTFRLFGYNSFGYFLLGLVHIPGSSGIRLYQSEFFELWFQSIEYKFKYHNAYEFFNFLNNVYYQSLVNDENNVYIVSLRKYKKMIANKELILTE
ncbi:hypothetical protein N7603_07400 [Acholeplasma vituli]|uniref:RDD domain-containing protein n=1 Tax=Paracholeplasma vituli TaxID=69473 RepID=A0ABT2PYC5_9MOLU|nr:hypothetical protein [Paracholeplasma vituli]MCU0105481.1 hypothetical protein [Paracholeplasma vituli]